SRRRPPISSLFPYTTLFRSACSLESSKTRGSHEASMPSAEGLSEKTTFQAEVSIGISQEQRSRSFGGGELREFKYRRIWDRGREDRKSTRLNSSHDQISYAV